jgi:hypothetical protein
MKISKNIIFVVALFLFSLFTYFFHSSMNDIHQSPVTTKIPSLPTTSNKTRRAKHEDIAGDCYNGEKQWWRPARCPPDEWWLEPWVKRSKQNKKWTLVDVGANKGYTLTAWTEQLFGSKHTKFTAQNLGIALFNKTKQFGTLSHCGGCCECVEAPIVVDEQFAVKKENVQIIAFEPGPATARHLKEFFSTSSTSSEKSDFENVDEDEKVRIDIRWKAVAAESGKAFFPDVPIGKETGKLTSEKENQEENNNKNNNNTKSKPKMVQVDVVTLDEELKSFYSQDEQFSENGDGIDVLTTDVEGLDQDVARGAKKLLSSGKVGVYIFEMNRQENYTAVFSFLHDVAGFECYFGTERRFVKSNQWRHIPPLVRITGKCWKPEYETYSGWINAICVHRERAKEILPVVGSLTRKRWKIMMTCAGKKQQQKVVGRFLNRYFKEEVDEWRKKN